MFSALVLAAGLARRMGTNKLLLPFGERTVLAQAISVLRQCPLGEIVVVTGHEREQVEQMLRRYGDDHDRDSAPPWRSVHNPNYAAGDMLSSIQAGLTAMRTDCDAALVALGDQPQIERRIVEQVLAAHTPSAVIIPSFNRRGGHPILIDRACWPKILALPMGASLRELFHAHIQWLRYIDVDTESILRDMDTPEDYAQLVHEQS
jgi:molybdenum cofactor cytidylyltransferase